MSHWKRRTRRWLKIWGVIGALYALVSFLKIGGKMDNDEKDELIRRTERLAEHREQLQARLDSEKKADSDVKPGGSTPSLYALPEGAKELQDLIEHRTMNFAVGNIFKACYRLGQKDGVDTAYDLRKILFFAERERRRVEAMNGQANG